MRRFGDSRPDLARFGTDLAILGQIWPAVDADLTILVWIWNAFGADLAILGQMWWDSNADLVILGKIWRTLCADPLIQADLARFGRRSHDSGRPGAR